MTLLANNINLEIENTLGTATAITAITQANPGVVTSAGHGLANGDWVKILTSDGMNGINKQLSRVANVSVDDFDLEGIDTTNETAFSTGTFQKVEDWYTLCQATTINIGNAAPTEVDGTTLCSAQTVTLYGLPGSISGTIDIHHEPAAAAITKLKSATTSTILAFRATWSDGSISAFNAITAYSGGFNAALNSIITGQIPVTVPASNPGIVEYPS